MAPASDVQTRVTTEGTSEPWAEIQHVKVQAERPAGNVHAKLLRYNKSTGHMSRFHEWKPHTFNPNYP